VQELEINIGQVLGMALKEVQARYFVDSEVGNEFVEERNHGDVIENHYWSRRYTTEDLDGVPFAAYNSDD
jgi:hypothetical protein